MATITGNLPNCSHRYVLFASYIGSRYNGSQRLIPREAKGGVRDTVQEALEWSLQTSFPLEKCRTTSSSRTDKGVHAIMNCYSLPLMDFSTPTATVMKEANRRLANDRHEIVIKDAMLVSSDFHPRHYVKSREYIYKLAVIKNPELLNLNKATRSLDMLHTLPLTDIYRILPVAFFDRDKALAAIDLLQGEHDFASFSHSPDREDTVRDLELSLSEADSSDQSRPNFSLYQFHIKSRAFLHNQVRRLVGAVLSYAAHDRIKLDYIKYLIDNPSPSNWTNKCILAEPWGLYLTSINYDKSCFEGAIRTFSDGREEKVVFGSSTDESDDVDQVKRKLALVDLVRILGKMYPR